MTDSLSRFSWVKGSAVTAVEFHGDVAVLTHSGGGAFSIVRGTEYLGCCPTIRHARRYAKKVAA
jgi:hypothetical protein